MRAVFPLLVLMSACTPASLPLVGSKPEAPVYTQETFQADEKFSRLIDAPQAEACEAARRALLSQGYVIARSDTKEVQGAKRFQPEGEVHVEISFHIVCAKEDERTATLFVSAQQDRYTLKKNQSAASIGVSAIGSISVPLGASGDSLVKVASETIPAGNFYDRFFMLVRSLVRMQAEERALRPEAAASTGTPASAVQP
ncbi:DUF2242 domain-containing protein [Inhella gelatinilytica]|uniref:DUF2242 domain-containing protein n=1 Tax=Inhella gelatinilytica TaxID=2795030 RepID=A0A931IUZ7_9BURK|nr:DUF2242 domain-containing protein [Inhella gelatinilytica]MBH9552041.1 DUF2242 domain-containing protein [Inhella gelatinilytica]